MAIKNYSVVLNDSEGKEVPIEISTFPGRLGTKLASKLLRIASSFVKALPSDSSDSLLDKAVNFEALSKALVENLEESKVLSIIQELLTYTRVAGQEVAKGEIFDLVFSGEYGLLMGVLKFVLEKNFKSFFSESAIGKILARVQEALKTKK
jgi:hypothetical protein